jgi:hypothetical protein
MQADNGIRKSRRLFVCQAASRTLLLRELLVVRLRMFSFIKDLPVASNDIPIEESSITDWYYYIAVILFNTIDYFRAVVPHLYKCQSLSMFNLFRICDITPPHLLYIIYLHNLAFELRNFRL